LLGIQRGMEVRTYVARPKAKVRPRTNPDPQRSLRHARPRVRANTWLLRVATEDSRVGSVRAQFLANESPGTNLEETAWMAAFEQSIAEKAPPLFRALASARLEEERNRRTLSENAALFCTKIIARRKASVSKPISKNQDWIIFKD